MKTILVFEPLSGGHRSNFICWLKAAASDCPECRFVFFTVDDVKAVALKRLSCAGRWGKQVLLYRLFRQACRKYKPDHVLVLELTHLELPLILFGSPIPLSAILFVQYPELPRRLKFFLKHWKTRLLVWRVKVENLFLLNGGESCCFLDRHFGSRTRFISISDPAPEVTADRDFSFDVLAGKRICLFFGAISRRKGADILLASLKRLYASVAEKNIFMFCGEPEPDYYKDFQKSVAEVRDLGVVEIHVEEGFISDERMMAMFEQADLVLMPYTRPEYSSGILALAAKAGTPVLGSRNGLQGRLIQKYSLGAVSEITPDALADALEGPTKMDEKKRKQFLMKNTITGFTQPILDAVCNES